MKQRILVHKRQLPLFSVPENHLSASIFSFWNVLGQSFQDAILAVGSQMDLAQDEEVEVLGGSGESLSISSGIARSAQIKGLPELAFANSFGNGCVWCCVWGPEAGVIILNKS